MLDKIQNIFIIKRKWLAIKGGLKSNINGRSKLYNQ